MKILESNNMSPGNALVRYFITSELNLPYHYDVINMNISPAQRGHGYHVDPVEVQGEKPKELMPTFAQFTIF